MSPPSDDPRRSEGAVAPEDASSRVTRTDRVDSMRALLERLAGRGLGLRRYESRKEIAQGGMGAILRVWDGDLRRHLAMKVVLPRFVKEGAGGRPEVDERVLGRFLEEAQVTGQLDHPGIVPVHEIGLDEEGRLFFTMRLVRGRDLEQIFELVRDGKEGWTRTRAVSVLLKVCEAMAFAHAKEVIHRDLKPANVMVGRFGEVYVMDWGLARVLGREDTKDVRVRPAADLSLSLVRSAREDARQSGSDSPCVTLDGDVIGTPAYMSPEQARGELESMGPASDVYSVGAILYHLLAGHPPYTPPENKLNAYAVWGLVQAGPPKPLHELAPEAHAELVAICEKAMAREPAGRYATMQELADDLRAYLEGRVVHAYETGAFAELRKWVVRNRQLALTSMAAVLLIVAGTTTAALVLADKNRELKQATALAVRNEQRAVAGEGQAVAAGERALALQQLAEERAAKVLRLSDLTRLRQLEARSARLWPPLPALVPTYREWLRQAEDLVQRLPAHEATLAELRARALPADAEQEPEGRTWSFASPEDQWQHDTLAGLVGDLASFAGAQDGLVADVRARLEFAETVEERSVSGEPARSLWAEARAALADPARAPAYGGLDLPPQLGLLPLGPDPRSGLWEFAHLQSGAPPARDVRDGELQLTEASGVVLVLVPGGSFAMGAQADDPDAPNHDPQALDHEQPVVEVALAPYFLAKHELTQGQWLRAAGANPSVYGPDSPALAGRAGALLHPVEHVTWEECAGTLARLALELPTEAQWERAARAGTTTPWWTGAGRESLEGAANLADQAATRLGATWSSIADWPELDDEHGVHAPVGSFRANPFGLHDTAGNVFEWCRDAYGPYGIAPRHGDGLREGPGWGQVTNRGGSFMHAALNARSSHRNRTAPDARYASLGVRPARTVER